jgi:hypothetical protein
MADAMDMLADEEGVEDMRPTAPVSILEKIFEHKVQLFSIFSF